jgi:aminoglycoside phosphotransferase family enzyme/predicted kinase
MPAPASGQLIAGLLRPAAYPHPVHQPIRVAETHISWVLLTGEFAYKVKKPIRLSFLDYSTLDRRRALCEEELRLNRRLAPGLYLGVSTICGPTAAPRVDGDGDGAPVEYAVRMRQFAPQDELAALLAADTVTAADLAQLGAAIASFHLAATVVPASAEYGRPDIIQQVTLDNFAELRALPEAAAWHSAVDNLERDVTALHARLRPRMLERQAAGWVRECHGDLHCGNVVRRSGALTPFDGIEFDPKLRFIDVVNDIAFLTMDLAERSHAELRHAVLQAWVEALGAWTALPLLPYYEAYRALVRAKVDALRALQLETGSALRAAAVEDCSRYLAWARARVAPHRPALMITCGLSGSGKTWLARRLASRLGALHVRSDVERKRLAGLEAHADSRSPPDAGIYSLEFNARTYAHLHDCAAAALVAGESIVVDAAFLRHGERQQFLDLARRVEARFTIVHCRAPEAVLRQRVAARAAARNDASEAGLDVLQRQPGYWEPFDVQQQSVVVTVDTSDPSTIDLALQQIAHRDGQ